MDNVFRFEDFRKVSLSDRAELEGGIFPSSDMSCEITFTNLLNWSCVYDNSWQKFQGLICIWMHVDNMLILCESEQDAITVEKCRLVSEEMKRHGFDGRIQHIRKDTLERLPELTKYYSAELMPDDRGEYIYRVDDLASLHGEKYSKKRNLIAQFKRNFPDYQVLPLKGEWISGAKALAESWRNGQDDPDDIALVHEASALEQAFKTLDASGMEGLVIVTGGKVAAFSMFSPIRHDVWGEPFEKADHNFKGASQMILQETAKALAGRAVYLNREQDLGIMGMRQAKQSFMPEMFLKNYILVPKFSLPLPIKIKAEEQQKKSAGDPPRELGTKNNYNSD